MRSRLPDGIVQTNGRIEAEQVQLATKIAGRLADVLAGKNPEVQINVDATAMALAGNGAVDIQNIISGELTAYVQRSRAGVSRPIDLIVRSKFNPNLRSGGLRRSCR